MTRARRPVTAAPSYSLRTGAGYLITGYGVRSLAYLGVTVLLARSLAPERYGQVALFMALAAAIAALAASWPFLAVPVRVAHGSRLVDVLLASGGIAILSAGVLGALAIPLTLALSDLGAFPPLVMYAFALLGFHAIYSILQTQHRMRAVATMQAAERVTALAVLLTISLASGLSLGSTRYGLAIAAGLTVAVAGVLLLPTLGRPCVRRTRGEIPTILKTVGPMAVVSAVGYVVAYIDLFLLAALADDRTVGIYALAYQVFMLLVQLASLWILVALPRHAAQAAVELSPADMIQARQVPMAGHLWSAAVLFVAVGACVVLVPVFGDTYELSRGPLLVLLMSTPVLAAYYAAVPVLVSSGRARALAWISLAGLAVNVALDLLLIPAHGAGGAAVATAVQNGVVTVGAVLVVLRWREAAPLLATFAPATACLAVLVVAPDVTLVLVACGLSAVGLLVAGIPVLRGST